MSTLSADQETALVNYYNTKLPHLQVLHCAGDVPTNSEPNLLSIRTRYHSYMVLDGHHILPSKSRTNAPNSIIQMALSGTRHVGQVFDILSHTQARTNGTEYLLV